MSQIDSSSSTLMVVPELNVEQRRAVTKVTPQAAYDFNVALRNADRHEADDEDDSQPDRPHMALAGLMPQPLQGSTSAQGAYTDVLTGGGVMTALPNPQGGTLPDAVPRSANISQAVNQQQWRVNIPSDGLSGNALAMRLVNSGAGLWQVRLQADDSTRQQLTPHLERLRDKLRQRSDGRFDDLGFDDDNGPDSEA
ncbi:MAG: hypothetical protein LBE78_13145 [Burkholderiaceae bacterium]|nr:hypothetical protein [Burkholderiaceae bacterium]